MTRTIRGRNRDDLRLAVVAALGLVLPASATLGASCPTVADTMGLSTAYPEQAEVEEASGLSLTYTENPMFDADVKAGSLPAVADRLPEQPLIVLPYVDCGHYGGTIEGTSRAPTSGTSDILSWRQAVLVRISDDLKTIVPNVARSWKWNDDYTAVTFELRKGHKWSDGEPFTADDVVFFFEDIIQNKDLNPETTKEWGENPHAKAIDETHVEVSFDKPFPGFLTYVATSGSYFSTFAPKHFFEKMMPKYNANADADAKAAGFDDWTKRFTTYYQKWHDDATVSAAALEVPTLEAHIVAAEPNTQERVFKPNPYYFKVDSSGQQLPYIDKVHERFLTADLQVLAILNGEIDVKAQGPSLSDFPTYKENEEKGGYMVLTPSGSLGTDFAFNITHADPKLRAIYGDLRFREAVSLALNRDEMNEVMYFGLGTPSQAMPSDISFAKPEYRTYMTEYDPDKSNALLDEMGMKRGADGMRTFPDGSPFTILWEYSSQFASPEFVKLTTDYLNAIGLAVNAKELTSEATRENAKAATSDINMEWDVPYEPNLIANIELYIPYYSDISPLFGVKWKQWHDSQGAQGEEPPDWAKEMFTLADEWKTLLPGTDRYIEVGQKLVELNQKNMTIIGTIGPLPNPVIVKKTMHNIFPGLEDSTVHFNFGYQYAFRPDQWYKD